MIRGCELALCVDSRSSILRASTITPSRVCPGERGFFVFLGWCVYPPDLRKVRTTEQGKRKQGVWAHEKSPQPRRAEGVLFDRLSNLLAVPMFPHASQLRYRVEDREVTG